MSTRSNMSDYSTAVTWPDYTLTGPGRDQAIEQGLASAEWFKCSIDRKTLKQLMKRTNRHALLHIGSWLLLMGITGLIGYLTWGTVWSVLAFAGYGILYAASDHWAHELSHGTPFKTQWLNTVFFQLTSFMTFHEAVYWRWSHTRHHTDTLIVGRDREIAVPRPPRLSAFLLDLFDINFVLNEIPKHFQHAVGIISDETKEFVPEDERPKMIRNCRLYVAIYIGVLAWCLAIGSILPALYIGLPRLYGGFLTQLFNVTQHAGLPENVLDHRKNCRTVYMNPVFRYLYVNMNYHVEHHMFPMMPYHALPRFHELVKDQCAPACPGLWAAYREIIPAMLRQRKDPDYYVNQAVPD